MFSFLNTIVLPALAAIAIPIIIHFFNRRKTKKIQFSSLRFLKMMENQRIRQVRLLQILLILIRTLFILFLVLTFARPALKSAFMNSASARTTAVILLDDSYSMKAFNGSVSDFQSALDKVKQILETFTPDDRVFIFPFSGFKSGITPVNLNLPVKDILKKYRESYRSPDISGVFKSVNNIYNDYPNYNKELFIVSDFKIGRTSLKDSVASILKNKDIITYLVNPVKENEQNNIGIDTVIVDNQLFEVNKPVRFTIRLMNYNMNEASETLVNLFNGDERTAMQQTSLNPGELKSVKLTFVPKKAGPALLHFEIDDDNLLTDNHYYLNFVIPQKVGILFVADQPPLELETALKVMDTNSPLKIDILNYGQWVGKNLENYDLIVLYDPGQINPESMNRIKIYLKNKNILIFPGSKLPVNTFNSVFDRLTQGSILAGLNSSPGGDAYFALDENTTRLSFFKPVFNKETTISNLPRIFKYFRLAGRHESILTLKNGDALLARYHSVPGRDILLFSSLPENEWNDIAYQGLFVPMLYRILFTSAQTGQPGKTYQVGDDIAVSLPDLSLNEPYNTDIDQQYRITGSLYHL
ncbi:MAG: BatA domain-containing protein [Calditrichaceae bacterium]